MTRLRRFAASAWQARSLRRFAASAWQARSLRRFSASAWQARGLRRFTASSWHARRRGIAIAVLTTAVILGGGESLLACPLCFGAEETPLIDATKLGIIVMLGVTLAVQGGFAAFFLYLRNRARRMADADLDTEWSELQRGSRTS